MREWLRRLLGTDDLGVRYSRLAHRIHHVEEFMASATEQLTALSGKVDGLIGDVRAALDTINQDVLSGDAQAALDSLSAKVEAFAAEVGDRDGSDEPVVTQPEQPAGDGETTTQL